MSKQLLARLALLTILSLVLAAAPFTVSAEGMAYRETPVNMTLKVDVLDSNSEVVSFHVKPGEAFRVELFAAGGTGYEWELVTKDLTRLSVLSHSTAPVTTAPGLTGGKLKTVYVLQAKPESAGVEQVTFSLRRSWEAPELAARTVVCEVKVSKN